MRKCYFLATSATALAGINVLDGRFLVELARCEDADGEDPRYGSRW